MCLHLMCVKMMHVHNGKKMLVEKGKNLTEHEKPTAADLQKTMHAGAITRLGYECIVFDVMVPTRMTRRKRRIDKTNHTSPEKKVKRKNRDGFCVNATEDQS